MKRSCDDAILTHWASCFDCLKSGVVFLGKSDACGYSGASINSCAAEGLALSAHLVNVELQRKGEDEFHVS